MRLISPLFRSTSVLVALTLLVACGDSEPQPGQPDVSDDTRDTSSDSDSVSDVDAPKGKLVLNELAAAGMPEDWVEFVNAGEAELDLSGYWFRDNDDTHRYDFKPGTILAPGEYLVVLRDESGAGEGFDFGLGGTDGVFVYDGDNQLVDVASWLEGESPELRSWGRFPNLTGAFQTLFSPSPGEANPANPAQTCGNGLKEGFELCDGTSFGASTCESLGWGDGALACSAMCDAIDTSGCAPRPSALVINEVESDESDRVELFNGSDLTIDLAGYTLSDTGGGIYTFPSGLELAPNAYLVLEKGVHHTFGLGDADGVSLLTADGDLIDAISWQSGEAIPSLCRLPNGVGGFRSCDAQTFGSENIE